MRAGKINLFLPQNKLVFVNQNDQIFAARAHGKLLLTGEYAVLDGAEALAIPTRFGQNLAVSQNSTPDFWEKKLTWRSLESDGTCWFSADYGFADFNFENTVDAQTAVRLAEILREVRRQKPDFLQNSGPILAEIKADFPRSWGLGTSSTLVSLLAEWSGTDPYLLLEKTFGGSGYDLACARADGPILFKNLSAGRQENKSGQPSVEPVLYFPKFHNCLYFIYLGKKQDSRAGIHRYREFTENRDVLVKKISQLTREFLVADSLKTLEEIIREHEILIAEAVDLPSAQALFFEKFWGETKSLGAWGGDFVLATSDRGDEETTQFFNQLGFPVVFRFEEMILKK